MKLPSNPYGLDSKAIFERVGLDMSDLSDPDARYPDSKLLELWTLAIEEAADPTVWPSACTISAPSALHALGFAWLASTSLHEAQRHRLARYFRLITTGETLNLSELPMPTAFHRHSAGLRARPGRSLRRHAGDPHQYVQGQAPVRTCHDARVIRNQ